MPQHVRGVVAREKAFHKMERGAVLRSVVVMDGATVR